MKQSSQSGSRVAGITLLAPVAWGTTYVTVTEVLPADRPLFIAVSRVIPAGVVLLAIGTLRQRGHRAPHDWKRLLLLSLFNFGLFFPLLVAAIYRLPGGVAASVGGIQPLLVALAGWGLAAKRPKRFDLVIGAVAALGVAMVVVRPGASIDPVGVVAAVAANISFSVGVVLTKKFDLRGDRLLTTGLQLLLSAAVIVPVAVIVEGPLPDITGRHLAGFAYLSLIATGGAFVVWFSGIQRLPPQAPPVLGLAAPITGAVIGWIALNESLNVVQLAGFMITVGAITYAATLGSAPDRHEPRSAASGRLKPRSAAVHGCLQVKGEAVHLEAHRNILGVDAGVALGNPGQKVGGCGRMAGPFHIGVWIRRWVRGEGGDELRAGQVLLGVEATGDDERHQLRFDCHQVGRGGRRAGQAGAQQVLGAGGGDRSPRTR